MAANPNQDEVYLATANGSGEASLWAYSTATGQQTEFFPGYGYGSHLHLSSDGKILSFFDMVSESINRIYTGDFSSAPFMIIGRSSDYPNAIASTNDKIVDATVDGDLDLYDGSTEKLIVVRKGIFPSDSGSYLETVPGTDVIFAACGEDLYEFDVSTDSFTVWNHRVFSQPITGLAIVHGTDSLLAVQLHDHVDLEQMYNLTTKTTIGYQGREVLSMCFAPGKAYIATAGTAAESGSTTEGVVSEFDIGNAVPVRSWSFESSSHMAISISRDDGKLYETDSVSEPDFDGYRTIVVKLK